MTRTKQRDELHAAIRGIAYESFISNYAANAGKSGGELDIRR